MLLEIILIILILLVLAFIMLFFGVKKAINEENEIREYLSNYVETMYCPKDFWVTGEHLPLWYKGKDIEYRVCPKCGEYLKKGVGRCSYKYKVSAGYGIPMNVKFIEQMFIPKE